MTTFAKTIRLQQRILDRLDESMAAASFTNDEWAKDLGVSKTTVQRAIAMLKDRYLIATHVRRFRLGRGWSVTRRIEKLG